MCIFVIADDPCPPQGSQESEENQETPSTDDFPQLAIVLSVVITVLFVGVLLSVVGLLHCHNHKGIGYYY